MLPHQHRLRQRSAFDRIYQQGHLYRGRWTILRCCPRQQLGMDPTNGDCPTRIAIIVSKKVSRRAVQRNRMKRRIRHQLATLLPRLRPGWDAIVTVKPLPANIRLPPALTCSAAELEQELLGLFSSAKLLDEPGPSNRDRIGRRNEMRNP